MTNFNWDCPFCNRSATITNSNFDSKEHRFNEGNLHGDLLLQTRVTVCPNKQCKNFELQAVLYPYKTKSSTYNSVTEYGKQIMSWKLHPQGSSKIYPNYIPDPILSDYREACLIRDLSPKASATLSRRCLQGMIRDFWGISKKRLIDEIIELKDKMDPITWEAVDSIRKIGNVGAHMEQDINIIVDVDPGEADLLIGLIETLLKDWYVTREERKKMMNAVIESAKNKDINKKLTTTINEKKD